MGRVRRDLWRSVQLPCCSVAAWLKEVKGGLWRYTVYRADILAGPNATFFYFILCCSFLSDETDIYDVCIVRRSCRNSTSELLVNALVSVGISVYISKWIHDILELYSTKLVKWKILGSAKTSFWVQTY